MYTGSSDHTGRAWVTEFGDCTRVFKGHKHTVSCIKFHDGLGECKANISHKREPVIFEKERKQSTKSYKMLKLSPVQLVSKESTHLQPSSVLKISKGVKMKYVAREIQIIFKILSSLGIVQNFQRILKS